MNSTSRYADAEIRTKFVRRSTGKHECANCGALISDQYAFCTRNVFGRIIEERCRREFESFWSNANAHAAQRIKQLADRVS